jgi:hypothetical protein
MRWIDVFMHLTVRALINTVTSICTSRCRISRQSIQRIFIFSFLHPPYLVITFGAFLKVRYKEHMTMYTKTPFNFP